jgi:hypothetical protein
MDGSEAQENQGGLNLLHGHLLPKATSTAAASRRSIPVPYEDVHAGYKARFAFGLR